MSETKEHQPRESVDSSQSHEESGLESPSLSDVQVAYAVTDELIPKDTMDAVIADDNAAPLSTSDASGNSDTEGLIRLIEEVADVDVERTAPAQTAPQKPPPPNTPAPINRRTTRGAKSGALIRTVSVNDRKSSAQKPAVERKAPMPGRITRGKSGVLIRTLSVESSKKPSDDETDTLNFGRTSSQMSPRAARTSSHREGDIELQTLPEHDVKQKERKSLSSANLDDDPTAMYSTPLLYFKRNNPILRRRNHDKNLLDPSEVTLPGGQLALGFPPVQQDDDALGEIADGDILVFSMPGQDQKHRRSVYKSMLVFLLLADALLVCLIYSHGPGAIPGSISNGAKNTSGLIALFSTLSVIILGLVGIQLRSTMLLSLFIVAFYVDSVITLLRVYTILQFAHFLAQVMICQMVGRLKTSLMATWFMPAA